jgi:hypothetical protein
MKTLIEGLLMNLMLGAEFAQQISELINLPRRILRFSKHKPAGPSRPGGFLNEHIKRRT